MTLRIGILGAARIAPPAVTRPARVVDDVEVVAVAARDRAKAEQFAAKHRIPHVLGSYEDIIASDEVDAIYNPLPNGLHGAWTIKAIEAGKHVLCEKPFTANAEEARQVADVAKASDVVVMEAFHWRYHPLATAVLDIIESGEIGDVVRVSAALVAPYLKPGDIRWDLRLAGGSMMDMGCYTVSQVRTFAGAWPDNEPTVTSATAKQARAGVDRALTAELEFPDGITGRIVTGMASGRFLDIHASVTGTDGKIVVLNPVMPQAVSRMTVKGRDGKRTVPVDREPTYVHQLRAFKAAVMDGAEVITHPEWSVANMQVIDDCYRAAGMEPRQPTPV